MEPNDWLDRAVWTASEHLRILNVVHRTHTQQGHVFYERLCCKTQPRRTWRLRRGLRDGGGQILRIAFRRPAFDPFRDPHDLVLSEATVTGDISVAFHCSPGGHPAREDFV